jgi:hypothetical protein
MLSGMKLFLLNLPYLIPGTISLFVHYNIFYQVFDMSIDVPDGVTIVIFIPFIMFYLMTLTFTILLHPIGYLILFFINMKKRFISMKYIVIIFVWSAAIAFIYLYLILGKGYILTV